MPVETGLQTVGHLFEGIGAVAAAQEVVSIYSLTVP